MSVRWQDHIVSTPEVLRGKPRIIDDQVLKKLGEISSTRGDRETARKANPDLRPLTRKEVEWTKAAIRAIIRQMGEYDPTVSLKQITMNDLPEL